MGFLDLSAHGLHLTPEQLQEYRDHPERFRVQEPAAAPAKKVELANGSTIQMEAAGGPPTPPIKSEGGA